MPKLPGLEKVLLIGSGPIVIGQAAEFDFSGSQACRALKEEGIQIVLANSNPATIQTDTSMADAIYLEPLTPRVLERIIEKEKPQAVLATMAGQTGLNLAVALKQVFAKHGVKMLGTNIEAIELAEDREKFSGKMREIGEPVPKSKRAHSAQEGRLAAAELGLPVMVRPDFCLGGTGSSIARNEKELEEALEKGLAASGSNSVLIENSLEGLAEMEYEIIRDAEDNCIAICAMENFDPIGVHTGESIVVAPSQTLSDDDHQMLRSAAIRIIRALKVVGACNVQFALDQSNGKYWVVEVNPRTSRSSALASKATGYPIARVAAKIAIGYSLPEIENKVTGKTACFEPAIDYVVLKIPRWPFDKMKVNGEIGTSMKSTGEAMAIGRTFEEALHKAVRSLELRSQYHELAEGLATLAPSELRLFQLKNLLAKGKSVQELAAATKINAWFLHKLANIAETEKQLARGIDFETPAGARLLEKAKKIGLPDARIATLSGRSVEAIRGARKKLGLRPSFKMVDTCAGEFEAVTPYFYSTYDSATEGKENGQEALFSSEAKAFSKSRLQGANGAGGQGKKIIVLGSGPIRIGQGIEFDYCTVHAVQALRELGFETIVINNNPETVSTDFDVSDKLYFEPLTLEDVLAVIEHEREACEIDGSSFEGVMVQFGGQTALNLARPLKENGVKILGTSVESLELAGDRKKFRSLANRLKIPLVNSAIAYQKREAMELAEYVGFPLLVRPSFVLGGRAMQVAENINQLESIVDEALIVSQGHPIILDHFLNDAVEIDVDVISEGNHQVFAGIMQQVEEAGIHSGDSCCVLPAQDIPEKALEKIREYTRILCSEMNIIGLANLQMMVKGEEVTVLEVNPRASRTVPFVSKATGVQIAKIAAGIQTGALTLKTLNLPNELTPLACAVKAPVFPFAKFPGIDPRLGAEMKSTGETMGIASNFEEAFAKADLASGAKYGNSAVVCHTGRWQKTIVEHLSQAGVRVFAPYSSQESAALLKEGRATFLVCGLEGEHAGSHERKLAASLGLPCISSAFKALAIARTLAMLKSRNTTGEELPLIELASLHAKVELPAASQ